MEEAAAKLSSSIDSGRKDKALLLADIMETEKQVTRHAFSCSILPFHMSSEHTFTCADIAVTHSVGAP